MIYVRKPIVMTALATVASAIDRNMMTNNRILLDVNAEPFRPFRIKMVSGEVFEIRHPEMIQVGRTTATVFTWLNENVDNEKEREREISILLIESIEPLKSMSPQDQP